MKKIMVGVFLAVIIAGLGVSTAFAATYGKQFPRGVMVGVVEGDTQVAVYRVTDSTNGATCYVSIFGKSGSALSCVK